MARGARVVRVQKRQNYVNENHATENESEYCHLKLDTCEYGLGIGRPPSIYHIMHVAVVDRRRHRRRRCIHYANTAQPLSTSMKIAYDELFTLVVLSCALAVQYLYIFEHTSTH